jgi:hypothetical protein
MELHVEFQPHRFITRFNAIQRELDAREVVYIEDEDEEEEEEGAEGEDADTVEEVEGPQGDGNEEVEEEQLEGDGGTPVEPEAGDESRLTDGQGEGEFWSDQSVWNCRLMCQTTRSTRLNLAKWPFLSLNSVRTNRQKVSLLRNCMVELLADI